GGRDTTITQYDLSDPDKPRWLPAPLTGHTNAVASLAFCSDGRTLATGSYDGKVLIYDVSAEQSRPRLLNATLTGQNAPVWTVTYSPDGRMAATGGIQPTRRCCYGTSAIATDLSGWRTWKHLAHFKSPRWPTPRMAACWRSGTEPTPSPCGMSLTPPIRYLPASSALAT